MAISKNNPAKRDSLKLIVYCPETNEEMKIVKVIGIEKGQQSGMFYKCEKTGKYYPIREGSYKEFPHKWIGKK